MPTPRLSLLATIVAVAVLASGCAVSGEDEAGTSTRHRDLAVHAEKAKHGRGSESARRADARRRQPDAGSSAGATGAGAGGPAAAGSDPAGTDPAWTTVLRSPDPVGDQGPGPAYTDLTGVRVDEDGRRVRLVVTMAGSVPSELDDGKVQGIGLDVYRGGGAESDYQVFLDGGADGWRGYLQGPAGLVEFPGSLVLDGPRLVVVVPWTSLGGRSGGEFTSFVDWSTDSGPLGQGGADTGPSGALDVG